MLRRRDKRTPSEISAKRAASAKALASMGRQIAVPLLSLMITLTLGAAMVAWVQSRTEAVDRRYREMSRQFDEMSAIALSSTPSTSAASAKPSGAAAKSADGQDDSKATGERGGTTELMRMQVGKVLEMKPSSTVMTMTLDSGQLIQGANVMMTAASFGDVPDGDIYIYDRGTVRFSFKAAAKAPVTLAASVRADHEVPHPKTAQELAILLAAADAPAVFKDAYYALDVENGYVKRIIQVEYHLHD